MKELVRTLTSWLSESIGAHEVKTVDLRGGHRYSRKGLGGFLLEAFAHRPSRGHRDEDGRELVQIWVNLPDENGRGPVDAALVEGDTYRVYREFPHTHGSADHGMLVRCKIWRNPFDFGGEPRMYAYAYLKKDGRWIRDSGID
jgi:hypothetical protein